MPRPAPATLLVFLLALLALAPAAAAEEDAYVPVTDPLVRDKLEEWQDLKFGLLMHWGAYSQWGIVESWSICPEDYGWCERKRGSNPQDYFTYKREYEALQTTFDPRGFQPEDWAKAAAGAGMRYVVFTTKHHDGFSMFDTRATDYKITSENCPFHDHPRADVTRAIFDAFRAEGLWAGAYFSKPDWHDENYWHPYFPPRDRNVNYDPEVYPERWEKFVQFTHSQIMELMTNYGDVDILWLDGGWVARKATEDIRTWYGGWVDETVSGFFKRNIVNQDIRMDELVARARAAQPGLIVVDRAVPGPHQNYLTPENRVPEEALPYPWESCIIAGGSWSWVPDATYLTTRQTVHTLVDIVAKGGNLLLNIAPSPEGTWDAGAYELLAGVGAWMDVNSEAIYGTRAISPYKTGRVGLTQARATGAVYAIHMAAEGETAPPAEIVVGGVAPADGARVTMLGVAGELAWERRGDGFVVKVPAAVRAEPPCSDAWTLRVSSIKEK
ncbi:alpha-L-fucosidase [bacterium]|nr:alpha-L-fucosidase [bacterium]